MKQFGVLRSQLKALGERQQRTAIAQLYKLVNGIILTKHIFQGLKRELYYDNKPGAAANKLVYTRSPRADYEWQGGSQGNPVKLPAPEGCVFAVIVSPNCNHAHLYPDIYGWIDRWNWIKGDSGLPEAPEGWVDRYDKKLWTRT